jgi:hypothetical protein
VASGFRVTDEPLRPIPPFVWPEPRILDGARQYADLPLADLARGSRGLFGTLSGLTSRGIAVLRAWLDDNHRLTASLIVTVHPACATRAEDLSALRDLAVQTPDRLNARVYPCDGVTAHPETALCFLAPGVDTVHMATGPTEDLGIDARRGEVNFVFLGDPPLVECFRRYFDWLWAHSRPVSAHGVVDIPDLAIPPGTAEGALLWSRYRDAWTESRPARDLAAIDPETGTLRISSPDGIPITSPTEALGLLALDDVGDAVARLYQKGSLVSIDKLSRVPPLNAPLNPSLFGLSPLIQRGAVTRRLSMHVSIIDERTLKEIDKRRQGIRSLLNWFSFALGDNMRWMPDDARPLFESELDRINNEGQKLLRDLLSNDVKVFVASRMPALTTDLNAMYRELGGTGAVTPDILNRVAETLAQRLERASLGNLLPDVTYSRVGFSASQNDWASPWGQAYSLLAAVAAFPRKVLSDGFFLRGLRVPEKDLFRAMDVADDILLAQAATGSLRDRCRAELDLVDRISDASISARERCGFAWRIIRGDRLDTLAADLTAKAGT